MRVTLFLGALFLASGLAWGGDAPDPALESPISAQASAMLANGKLADAITLLEGRLAEHPEDKQAANLLLLAKVQQKEAEIRVMLSEQAEVREQIVGDADYEAAKAKADEKVQRQLDVVEYYVARRQYAEAIDLCNALQRQWPNEGAVLVMKYQVLSMMVVKERETLLKEKKYRRGEGINEVIEHAIFPVDKPKLPRTVWIFDEDLAETQRAAVRAKLQERVTLKYNGTQVREVVEPLFAVAGVNYVILDSALGEETLTINLVDETVEAALNTIAKLVNVTYNYSAGTVFVSKTGSEVLVTEIIRLQSGLTDVSGSGDLGGGGAAGGGGGFGGGGGQGANLPPQAQAALAAAQAAGGGAGGAGGAAGGGGTSDLEKFMAKIPDIIVGWPADARWYLDRKSNTLYVRSTPSTIAELKRLLGALDYNNVQVLIETRFIEVSEQAQRELGIDWGFKGAAGNASIVGPGLAGVPGFGNAATITGTALPLASGVGDAGLRAGILLGDSLAMTIRALESKGQADTLSEPKILALNNSLGLIELTKQVSYISDYEARSTSTNSNVVDNTVVTNNSTALVPKFQLIDTGISLRIRPSIARNSNIITLSINPKVRELLDIKGQQFQYASSSGGNGVLTGTVQQPEIGERNLQAVLHVQNGQTIALGGLTSERDQKKQEGLPFVSEIPLIGGLFQRRSRFNERRNLIILVAAHIVDPSGAKLSDEIQKLRDTARVVMPAEARDALAGTNATKAEQAAAAQSAETAPAADSAGGTPWKRNGR